MMTQDKIQEIKDLISDESDKWRLDAGDWIGYAEELVEEVERLRDELDTIMQQAPETLKEQQVQGRSPCGQCAAPGCALPSPYFEDEHCTIYHGDCRQILPLLPSVDLVITDPPYGMSFQSNHSAKKHKKIANDDTLPLDLIYLAMSKARNASYFFCRWDSFPVMPKPTSTLAWVKNNWSMGDLNHEHGRQWEACLFYPGAGHEFHKRIPDVIHADRTGNVVHPTEKPVDLLATIIRANVGDVVLDPFMGSGTTLRAAKNCGRKSIGIELDEKYCEIAVKRLAQQCLF